MNGGQGKLFFYFLQNTFTVLHFANIENDKIISNKLITSRSLPRLAKSSSENSNMSFNKIGTFNIKSNGVLSRSASADMKPSMSSISRKGSHHEQVKIKSPGSQKRSSSAEPEFLRFWMEKDRAVSASTNNIEQGSRKINSRILFWVFTDGFETL